VNAGTIENSMASTTQSCLMNKSKAAMIPEMAEFEAALLRSMDQTARGEGRVNTPEKIQACRVGRPVGPVKAAPKVSTTIRLSPDVIQAFRTTGGGWQTRIDAVLKDSLQTNSPV
jgi:uncharacterized protein (DUF4415 family)